MEKSYTIVYQGEIGQGLQRKEYKQLYGVK